MLKLLIKEEKSNYHYDDRVSAKYTMYRNI